VTATSSIAMCRRVWYAVKQLPVIREVRYFALRVEGRCFDFGHNIDTQGRSEHTRRDYCYVPTRAAWARGVLRNMPISNPRDYTFVDLGSGKGLMMLLAAELPFRKVIGVELRRHLHETAVANLRQYRHFELKCLDIESLNLDATEFEFPKDNLVLYMFNPFGSEVMEKVLNNLQTSMLDAPRSVVLIMLFPDFAHLVDGAGSFALYSTQPLWRIYRSRIPANTTS
jgi:hypothetical protein